MASTACIAGIWLLVASIKFLFTAFPSHLLQAQTFGYSHMEKMAKWRIRDEHRRFWSTNLTESVKCIPKVFALWDEVVGCVVLGSHPHWEITIQPTVFLRVTRKQLLHLMCCEYSIIRYVINKACLSSYSWILMLLPVNRCFHSVR